MDRGSTSAQQVDPALLLGRLAAELSGGAPLAAALDLLVDGLALRSAVLRREPAPPDTDHVLLGVAGDVVHAVPGMRTAPALPVRASVAVDLPVPGRGGRPAAVLTVVGTRPDQLPDQLPVLSAAAGVLGLALATVTPAGAPAPALAEPSDDASALLLDADEEADALADALHDGPVQDLVAARYACDAALRGGDPAVARDAVQEALVALRRTLWHLRPRAGAGLPDALAALSDRLVESGGTALVLVVDEVAAARLPAPARALAYRLVQSVARDADGPVRLVLRLTDDAVHSHDDVLTADAVLLDVDGGRPLDEPDRWRRRLRALGGDLTGSAGRLLLQLPVPPSPAPAPAPSRPAPPRPAPPADTKACS